MFKGLQKKLLWTFLFFSIMLMTAISIVFLYISYQALYERTYYFFRTNVQAIYTTVFDDFVADSDYYYILSTGDIIVYANDHGQVRNLNSFTSTKVSEKLFLDVNAKSKTRATFKNGEFTFSIFDYKAPDGKRYFASSALDVYEDTTLVALYPKSVLYDQIKTMAIKSIGISVIVIILLLLVCNLLIKRAIEPAKVAYQKQKDFVSSAAHELRMPLTLIKSSLYTAQQTPEDAEKYYAIADSECSRMSALVGDLLTLSRMDKSTLSTDLTEDHIEPVLFQCYNNFEEYVAEKGLGFHIHLPEKTISLYRFDKNRILQLLTILMDNACQYTKTGSITLEAYEQKGHLYLVVADTGCGIKEQDLTRIFDRFYQGDRAHSNPDHFGLGLSIAAEIVHMHGGTISVSETAGGGATFTVRL